MRIGRDVHRANASIDEDDADNAAGGVWCDGFCGTGGGDRGCRCAGGGPIQGGAVRLHVWHLRGRRDHMVVNVLVQVGRPKDRQADGLWVPVLDAV